MKPFARPVTIRHLLREPIDGIQRHDRSPLHQHAGFPQLSLDKYELRFAISPDAVLASPEVPIAVKDMPIGGIEIQACRVVPVIESATAVGIGLQVLPRPFADLLAPGGREDELNL